MGELFLFFKMHTPGMGPPSLLLDGFWGTFSLEGNAIRVWSWPLTFI